MNKLQNNSIEPWMVKLWKWADDYHILNLNNNKLAVYIGSGLFEIESDYSGLPRNKKELIELKQLKISSYDLIPENYHTGDLVDTSEIPSIRLGNFNVKISIVKLPKEIINLHNLESLDIQNTNLTKLPKEIGSLYKLNKLTLLNNHFLKFPKEVFLIHNSSFAPKSK